MSCPFLPLNIVVVHIQNGSDGVLIESGSFVHECITDGQFIGEVLSKTKVAEYDAIVPKVTGQAFITGFHQIVVDPRDPLKQGFLLG